MKVAYKRRSLRLGGVACAAASVYVAAMSHGDLLVLAGAGLFAFLSVGLLLRASGDSMAISSDSEGVSVPRLLRATRLAWSDVASIEAEGDWLVVRRAGAFSRPIRLKASVLDLGGASLAETARGLLALRGEDRIANALATAVAAGHARGAAPVGSAPAPATPPTSPAQALEAALRARSGQGAPPPAFGRRAR